MLVRIDGGAGIDLPNGLGSHGELSRGPNDITKVTHLCLAKRSNRGDVSAAARQCNLRTFVIAFVIAFTRIPSPGETFRARAEEEYAARNEALSLSVCRSSVREESRASSGCLPKERDRLRDAVSLPSAQLIPPPCPRRGEAQYFCSPMSYKYSGSGSP